MVKKICSLTLEEPFVIEGLWQQILLENHGNNDINDVK